MSAVSVKSVSKSYRDKTESVEVLSNVGFDLEAGDLCSLFGPSGAGKTTLLNIIGGLDIPDEGQVLVGGVRIDSLDEKSKAKLRSSEIGIVFQNPNLIAHLNALENVLLPSLFDSKSDVAERKAKAVSLLRRLKLESKERRLPPKLSDGEKRRVSVARALISDPRLILADEPTINLDSENRDAVLELIKESTEKGAAALVATHDIAVSKLSGKILKIKFGKLDYAC